MAGEIEHRERIIQTCNRDCIAVLRSVIREIG